MVVREMSADPATAPRQPDRPEGPGRPDRWGTVLRRLALYGPVAAGYGVFQSLVGTLPDSMPGTEARYFLAVSAGLATGIIVRLSALLAARSRGEPEPAPGAAAPAGPDLGRIVEEAARTLLETRSSYDDPSAGHLTGWSHFLEDNHAGERPTAIGTAYGLHCALTLALPDGLLDTPSLVETLWRLQRPDGGWAARTGTGVSRPEVTGLVLGALSRAGADPGRIARGADGLDRMLRPETDPDGLARTYVVTTTLRGLVRAAPGSAAVERLRTLLVAGSLHDEEHGGLLCWGQRLGGPRRPVPSTAHTALVVVALARAARVRPEDAQSRQAREQGIRWLGTAGSLDQQIEHTRRPHDSAQRGYDHAVVRHFTAAWVAKALMSAPPTAFRDDPAAAERHEALLRAAVAAVRKQQVDGVWVWRDDDGERRPIWMTYQGLSVVRAPELSGWTAAR